MIALVISIIVMLILAGVSISAIVGEDGVLTKARAASIASRKASILEDLNLELASYNIDAILKSPEETTTMLGNLISKGLIDTVLSSSEEYVAEATSPMGIPQFDDANNYTGYIDYAVKKEDYSIIISIDDSGIYKAEYGDVTISAGGSVAGGTTLVTDKAFTNNEGATAEEQGKFVIDNDASVMFVDEISGELSIQVKSGTHAKVYAFKDMTLTNSGIKRSAIDIEPGGVLDLFVAEGATVTVNSGLGSAANQNNSPGKGGYAGIHVPGAIEDINNDGYYTYEDITNTSGQYNCAILNLSGEGTLKAYGGNGGSGSLFSGRNIGGSGGGGAGAGIGGSGGQGGKGLEGTSDNGGKGESCGIITMKNAISVYAYGGNPGSGAMSDAVNATSGGGYPAAGIGGGGAGSGGGSCCSGGGGYCGGSAEGDPPYGANFENALPATQNGLSDYYPLIRKDTWWAMLASSYYNTGLQRYNANYYPCSLENNFDLSQLLGGMGGCGNNTDHRAGDGGIAGSGGIIKVSTDCIVNAYNGNRYTDGTSYNNGMNQALIYAQQGIGVAQCEWQNDSNTVKLVVIKPQREIVKTNYVNPTMKTVKVTFNSEIPFLRDALMSSQGIGSGAGYIEVSNGTYTVDESMN